MSHYDHNRTESGSSGLRWMTSHDPDFGRGGGQVRYRTGAVAVWELISPFIQDHPLLFCASHAPTGSIRIMLSIFN